MLAGAAAIAAAGIIGSRSAQAATTLNWMGWQGYDSPLKQGTFLADNDIELATTYIAGNEEIITKLQAGGAVDLATIYFGHVPIMIGADLVEPIDESKVPDLGKVFPRFLDVDSIRRDGKLYAVPFTWGTLPMIYDPGRDRSADLVEDCLKDEYKGKVAIADDLSGLISTWSQIVTGTTTPTRLTHAAAQGNHRFPDQDQEGARPHLFAELWRGDRPFRPRRGGDLGDRLGCAGRLCSAEGQEARLCAAEGRRDGLHGHARHPEERGQQGTGLQGAWRTRSRREAQAVLAKELTQAVVNSDAVALVDDGNQAIYQYDNLDKLLERAKFNPFWPLESDGTHATFAEVQDEYQRFLQA